MRTESQVVMLTDMKGFTAATSRQTRQENARMLALHDALLSPVITAFGGRRVKSIGDAYLVRFPAPTAALLCAAAIQDRLADHARRVVEGDRIAVRIALAMGDVRLEGGDVFGEAVNLASRIEGQAAPGEIWFSEALYWALDRTRVPVEELGWHALDGLKEEARLFRVLKAATVTEGDLPYAGIGLDLISGLAPPEPERLQKLLTRRRPLGGLGNRATAVAKGALALLLLAALAAGGWWRSLPAAERAVRLGRFEEARLAIDAMAARRGEEDPQVLFLRGRLELARVDVGAGGGVRLAYHHFTRAVAAGSHDAVAALEREGHSPECLRRRLAARALADSRVREALEPLEALAEAEPPAPEAGNVLERARRAVVGDGRCGAGDMARQGIAELEALHRGALR